MTNLLKTPSFMTQREHLLKSYCTLEMRGHAINHGARILLNSPEIDEYGYDLMIEEDYYYLPIQLKAKARSAGTDRWDIWAGLIRPSFHDQINNLDLTVDEQNIGVHGGSGGIILQEFDDDVDGFNATSMGISYHYCDFFYILSIARGFWQSSQFTQEEAEKLLLSIKSAKNSDRFSLPRKAFFPLKSPGSILDLRMHIGGPSNYVSIFMPSNRHCTPDSPAVRLFRMTLSAHIPEDKSDQFPSYRTRYAD